MKTVFRNGYGIEIQYISLTLNIRFVVRQDCTNIESQDKTTRERSMEL